MCSNENDIITWSFLFWLLGLVVFLSLPPGLLSIMAQLAGAPRSARKHLNAHSLFPSLFGRYRHGLGVVAVLDVVGLEAVLDQHASLVEEGEVLLQLVQGI